MILVNAGVCPLGEPTIMSRRLAAIVVADVVGYSRLLAEDEAGTLAALRSGARPSSSR